MVIHFWQLPENRNYIMFRSKLKKELFQILEAKKYPWKIREKIKRGKISIRKLKLIAKKEKISLEKIEKSISWIGGNNSRGLSNPRFPINFSSRGGARFIAAIINDGTLTKEADKEKIAYGRLMYDNFDKSLRESVIKDCLTLLGGKKEEIAFRDTMKKKYLDFSSVTRDIVALVIKQKGPKSENNIKVPEFILKNKEAIIGWIEQTIGDEGEVKYYPSKYRRAIIWRRSLDITSLFKSKIKKDILFKRLKKKKQDEILKQKFNLIESEKKMLTILGINYIVYNLGIYWTKSNKIRTRWQITLTKRENLIKLRNLINIPFKEKNKKFTRMISGFVRYKEPIKIKKAVIKLGNKKVFTSLDLKKSMEYKQMSSAIKWLKLFEKKGMIKKIKKSTYGGGKYRTPARYTLTLNK